MGEAGRRVAFVLTSCDAADTVLGLAERLHARGQRVSVVAHGSAARLSAVGAATAPRVRALVRAGAHGAPVDWVVDADSAASYGQPQEAGAILGDAGDLWELVRAADVVLSPGRAGGA